MSMAHAAAVPSASLQRHLLRVDVCALVVEAPASHTVEERVEAEWRVEGSGGGSGGCLAIAGGLDPQSTIDATGSVVDIAPYLLQ